MLSFGLRRKKLLTEDALERKHEVFVRNARPKRSVLGKMPVVVDPRFAFADLFKICEIAEPPSMAAVPEIGMLFPEALLEWLVQAVYALLLRKFMNFLAGLVCRANCRLGGVCVCACGKH